MKNENSVKQCEIFLFNQSISQIENVFEESEKCIQKSKKKDT